MSKRDYYEVLGINRSADEKEIKRASGMLSNPNFVSKAPEAKVKQEKEKLAPAILDLEKRILQMNEELDALGVSVRNAEKTKSK